MASIITTIAMTNANINTIPDINYPLSLSQNPSGSDNEPPHGKREPKVRRGIKPDFANKMLDHPQGGQAEDGAG
jgi:hypothetical protein